MTTIKERLYARIPFGKAPSYLNYVLDELARGDRGGESSLRLEVPLGDLGLPSGLALTRDVVARFTPLSEEKYGSQVTAVEWVPEGGGPYPKFSGTITIETDEDYTTCSLLLEGRYVPPFGPLGALFDGVIGQRIARATAHELLKSLRGRLESDYLLAMGSAR